MIFSFRSPITFCRNVWLFTRVTLIFTLVASSFCSNNATCLRNNMSFSLTMKPSRVFRCASRNCCVATSTCSSRYSFRFFSRSNLSENEMFCCWMRSSSCMNVICDPAMAVLLWGSPRGEDCIVSFATVPFPNEPGVVTEASLAGTSAAVLPVIVGR